MMRDFGVGTAVVFLLLPEEREVEQYDPPLTHVKIKYMLVTHNTYVAIQFRRHRRPTSPDALKNRII